MSIDRKFEQAINDIFLSSRAQAGIPTALTADERLWIAPTVVSALRKKRKARGVRQLKGTYSPEKRKAA
jgi:hypothetical protein